MDLKEIRAQMRAIRVKQRELRDKATASQSIDELRSLNAELSALAKQMDALEDQEAAALEAGGEIRLEAHAGDSQSGSSVGRMQILAAYGLGVQGGEQVGTRGVVNPMMSKELREAMEEKGRLLLERRAAFFTQDEAAELRAITVASGSVVTGKAVSPQVAPAFPQASSIVDLVNSPVLVGAESYQKAFMISAGEGGYTTEGTAYAAAEPSFDYVDITKTKITAYAEISEELKRLSPADYATAVFNAVRDAVRKKLGKEIILGDGAAGHLTGIHSAPAKVIPVASDLEISAIDKDTLDTIVLAYGGEEAVELDQPCLILNKSDLAAFAAVRATDGKKLYAIEYAGGIGTISSDGSFRIRFAINSATPALSAAGTPVGTLTMCYGFPTSYEMPLFSNLEVQESADYKFKEGLVAIKGMVLAGGNVGRYKGFVRIKKKAAA